MTKEKKISKSPLTLKLGPSHKLGQLSSIGGIHPNRSVKRKRYTGVTSIRPKPSLVQPKKPEIDFENDSFELDS
ncbi:MAG: hypothetical protein HOE90_12865 [Bacteriovoracaceae bacterium]|jgi:hypothetical protein|nr:hypothetical protein [Bacteriovoracaceae bacterium]